MRKSSKSLLLILILVLLVFIILLLTGNHLYTEWLWFKNLNLSRTFSTIFFSNYVLRMIIGLLSIVFIFKNLLFTRKPFLDYVRHKKSSNVEYLFSSDDDVLLEWINSRRLTYIYLFISLITGFLFTSIR